MASRRRTTRRSSLVDITSDDESETDSEESNEELASSSLPRKRSRRLAHQDPTAQPAPSKRPSRRNTNRGSQKTYKEDTTDEEEFNQLQDIADDEVAPPRPKRRKLSTARPSRRPRQVQRKLQPGAVRKPKVRDIVSDRLQWVFRRNDDQAERRPPYFETLPFQIWTDILEYASYPMFDPLKPQNMENRRWLARACRTCKALLDPAVTALYRAPPIASVHDPHEVFDLLMSSKEDRGTSKLGFDLNYNAKVQRLEFDANTLASTAHGRGRFDLTSLVPVMPQLHSVRISSVFDLPENRKMQRTAKWDYPEGLVPALNHHGRRLKSFEWHQSLCAKEQDLPWIQSVHLTDAYQSITDLKLSGFEAKEPKKRQQILLPEQETEKRVAETLAVLPMLQSLEFEGCSVLNGLLLSLLPHSLQTLNINDCGSFDSAMFTDFLSTHGSQLKQLILLHNKSLDMRFLTGLKHDCPKLEVLKMDLNYYNTHRTFFDSGPNYIDLLSDDDVPSWPSSLRVIELLHLRSWTDTAARTFFASLADSAEQLPDLRTLIVKAILGLGWRERKAFRNEWVSKLEHVFLRRTRMPDSHFTTIASGRAWLDELRADPSLDRDEPATLVPAFTNLLTPPSEEKPSTDRVRLRPRRQRATYSESSDEKDEESDSSPQQDTTTANLASVNGTTKEYIQGLCDIVDVTIDNLRPAEKQWGEEDFLDSEPSDDEEWDPNAGDTGELYDGWAA